MKNLILILLSTILYACHSESPNLEVASTLIQNQTSIAKQDISERLKFMEHRYVTNEKKIKPFFLKSKNIVELNNCFENSIKTIDSADSLVRIYLEFRDRILNETGQFHEKKLPKFTKYSGIKNINLKKLILINNLSNYTKFCLTEILKMINASHDYFVGIDVQISTINQFNNSIELGVSSNILKYYSFREFQVKVDSLKLGEKIIKPNFRINPNLEISDLIIDSLENGSYKMFGRVLTFSASEYINESSFNHQFTIEK